MFHSAKQVLFSALLLFTAVLRGGKALSKEMAVQMIWCFCFGQAQCRSEQASSAALLRTGSHSASLVTILVTDRILAIALSSFLMLPLSPLLEMERKCVS